MEPLLKGKAQYSSPPCPSKLRSAAFDTANIIYFFTKQATLNEGVNNTEPSPPFSVP
jgi:hypothetical protein